MIEYRALPDQRLHLEKLAESRIASGEHETQSLEELFDFRDGCSYFLN
jgi:hypothetical protein